MTPATAPGAPPGGARPIDIALLASVFVVAACGLLYELAAGALASYVLGDSVLQFSTIIVIAVIILILLIILSDCSGSSGSGFRSSGGSFGGYSSGGSHK